LPAVVRIFRSVRAVYLMTEVMSCSVEGTTMAAHPFGDTPKFDQREIWLLVEKITSDVEVRIGKSAIISSGAIASKDCTCHEVWFFVWPGICPEIMNLWSRTT
jgi:hypothetical protein